MGTGYMTLLKKKFRSVQLILYVDGIKEGAKIAFYVKTCSSTTLIVTIWKQKTKFYRKCDL